MCPAPATSGVAAVSLLLPKVTPLSRMSRPRLSSVPAVVISADRIMAGVQLGYSFLISAAMPATCRHAMEVPEMML